MVSHNPSEIYQLSQKVIVLDEGKVVKETTAKELFLKTKGSQKFAFYGELLELKPADVIVIAVVAVGEQMVEVVMDKDEAKTFTVGDKVQVSSKAFAPSLSKI